jgi:hypothetical protein
MIIRGWRKSIAMSRRFQVSVAKTIHTSEKAVPSAMGRYAKLAIMQSSVPEARTG